MSDFSTRLQNLRDTIVQQNLSGFLVPMEDEYQSEYVPDSAQRIRFLSGFTGSAGFIIVLANTAAFFTDGRYTLQASQQVPADLYTILDSGVTPPTKWLEENTTKDMRIGYDPWLHTADYVERLKKAVSKAGVELIPTSANLVDSIWHNRPALPAEPVFAYDLTYAGKKSTDKRMALADDLKKRGLAAAVITDPASVAWLLNVRGNDVPNTPLPLSFAILYASGKVMWFVAAVKITQGLAQHLGGDVSIEDPGQFIHALTQLAKESQPIRIDSAEAASAIVERLRVSGAKLDFGEDPCVLPKACKNPVEIEGMQAAHRRDGAALVKFFTWLETEVAGGTVTELSAEEKLAACRKENNLYRGLSFDTIAGFGGHGAIVHYRATTASNGRLEPGNLFLLDSGGQYLDGTTDVTRTVAIGAPTTEMRDRFTRVLKGHIALASIRFPEGTTGAELDALARQYLWGAGLDYNHGTGHGVGSFLGVHEGPQGISKRNRVPLKPGMVVSNEPGFYKTGQYGIRIENLQVVTEIVGLNAERKMLGFEPLTLCPIDRRLIDVGMLTKDELNWLNAYHTRVHEALRPMLDAESSAWLVDATREI